MSGNIRSIEEINQSIANGNVNVLTADEMTKLVGEIGVENAAKEVDVVTTGTFGAMCSSGVLLNFGHADPPIKIASLQINDVEAYSGVAAVDAYLGATQPSAISGIKYGGGHVIEDLVRGKSVVIKAKAQGTDCYPRTELETEITINDLNQAIMFNPRNGYERYNVATNSSDRVLYTYMGKLRPNCGNATFSGAGEISPIINDSNFQTIGIGTRIFLGGGEGFIVGNGTQHNPESGFSTLMVKGDLKQMSPEFIRGASFKGYGCSLYVGMGVPIPILSETIAKNTSIADDQIVTDVIDYSVQARKRPVLKQVNYAELKSGEIEINGQEIRTSPISSFSGAKHIATSLKQSILNGGFFLTQAVKPLSVSGIANPMKQKEISKHPEQNKITTKINDEQYISHDKDLCINCGLCLSYCSSGVFSKNELWEISVKSSNCTFCLQCQDICPQNAIHLKKGGENK